MAIFKDNVLVISFVGLYLLGYLIGAVYDYGAVAIPYVLAIYLVVGAGLAACLWIEER